MLTTLLDKQCISGNIFLLTFKRDDKTPIFPGQFANIMHKSKEKILRRPFSIFSFSDDKFSVLVKNVGRGTEAITEINKGNKVDILYPLGKGFNDDLDSDKTLFVAGGMGIAGLYSFLCKKKKQNIIIGDRKGEFKDVIKYLGINCLYVSESGKNDKKGKVTDFLDMFDFNTLLACGSQQMLKALKSKTQNKRYLVLYEEIMACGVGLCDGCAVKYEDNSFRKVCTDGPLLDGNRIIYD